jgi:chromosome partitioning protein
MRTIALVSQKSGSGKSTLAIGLAIAAMQDGHKVCLLETDPQGTVSNWRRRRAQSEPMVETVIAGFEIEQKLPLLEQSGVTLTLIDTAGGESSTTAAAIAAANLCLIPARPSPADIEAAAPTLSSVRRLDKPFAFILNQTPARSPRLEHAAAALGDAAAARREMSFNEISLTAMGVLARPCIVLRNDQQDARRARGHRICAGRQVRRRNPRPVALGLEQAHRRSAHLCAAGSANAARGGCAHHRAQLRRFGSAEHYSGGQRLEFNHRVEAMVATVATPEIPDFVAAAAFRELRIFRGHQRLATFRAARPPEITFMEKTHRGCGFASDLPSNLECHGESLRAHMEPCYRSSVSSLRMLLQ